MSTNTEDQDLHDGDEVIALAGDDHIDPNEDRGNEVASTTAAPAAEEDLAAAGRGDEAIPKARFNEVNAQRKEAQRQLEQAHAEIERLRAGPVSAPAPMRAAAPAVADFDEDAAEAAYAEALLEGDPKKAAAVRREINAYIRSSAAAEAHSISQAETVMAQLDRVTQQTLQDHPWLDTPAGDEALEMIIAIRDRKIASGVPAHRALALAVAAIAPKFTPEGAAPPEQGSPNAGHPADTRTRLALARGAAAADNQPPAIQAGLGNRTTASTFDVENLTEEQFDALTPAELKKMRGD